METNKIKAHFEKIVKALKEYNDLYKYVDSVFEVRRGLEALEQARADLASYQLTHEKLLKDYENLKKDKETIVKAFDQVIADCDESGVNWFEIARDNNDLNILQECISNNSTATTAIAEYYLKTVYVYEGGNK